MGVRAGYLLVQLSHAPATRGRALAPSGACSVPSLAGSVLLHEANRAFFNRGSGATPGTVAPGWAQLDPASQFPGSIWPSRTQQSPLFGPNHVLRLCHAYRSFVGGSSFCEGPSFYEGPSLLVATIQPCPPSPLSPATLVNQPFSVEVLA